VTVQKGFEAIRAALAVREEELLKESKQIQIGKGMAYARTYCPSFSLLTSILKLLSLEANSKMSTR
jgi:hypothetical protein